MKLASFQPRAVPVTRTGGLLRAGGVEYLADLALAYAKYLVEAEDEPLARELAAVRLPADMARLLAGGPASLEAARLGLEHVGARASDADELADLERGGLLHRLDHVRFLPPVPRPGKVISVGINYPEHVREAARTGFTAPDYPVAFSKLPSTLVGHLEPIVYPPQTSQLDYEGELCMVIGRRCRDVPAEAWASVVAGYTIINDVSMRDLQFAEMRRGILMEGKNLDTSGPLGPYLVTADEVADPDALEIDLRVNGEPRQHDRVANMVFPLAEQIAYWSRITLEPGDVITTGSPAGVAAFREDPGPYWLRPGDVVEVEITGLGVLCNPVVEHRDFIP